jgi:hypothetical protein
MRGKPMSKGWVEVDRTGTSSTVEFNAWIKEALDFAHSQ